MALKLFDRVQVAAVANTTVSFTPGTAATGYRDFTVLSNGDTTFYGAFDGTNWEVGIGTYVSSGPLLNRSVLSSSAGGTTPVSTFVSSSLVLWIDYPAAKSVYYDANNNVGIGVDPTASSGTLQVGTANYSDSGIIASFVSSINGYNQVILQNTNSGSSASTNFNVSNNNGTQTTNFGEFGINSSTFSGTGSFGTAGYTYLASASTDLAIGTYGANSIHFVINSGATDAMVINTSGNVGINGNPAVKFAISGTDAMLIPVGTTAQRPTGAAGYFRYNSDLVSFEGYNGTAWSTLGNPTISATAPSSPVSGNQWFDSTYGRTNIYYNDGTSSQWVIGQPSPDGILLDSLDGGTANTASYSRFIINCGGAT
jgi:hypothetical protein